MLVTSPDERLEDGVEAHLSALGSRLAIACSTSAASMIAVAAWTVPISTWPSGTGTLHRAGDDLTQIDRIPIGLDASIRDVAEVEQVLEVALQPPRALLGACTSTRPSTDELEVLPRWTDTARAGRRNRCWIRIHLTRRGQGLQATGGTSGTSRRTRVCVRFGPIDTQVTGVPE